MYRTLVLLLYGSGMCIGEALHLLLQDVDLSEQIITVRHTKFFKTRLVPIGPKLNREVAEHIERRRLLPLPRGEESPPFTTRDGRPWHYVRVISAVCGQCGRRMTVRYSGPDSACPVYCCLADRNQTGSSLCQEVRAPAVDEQVARILLKALEPDQIAIAIAALDEIAEETRSLEKQWALRRERARYDAERARRQYDTVEPENRLVARTLEKAWEDKLRLVDEIEQEYRRWRDREPLVLQAQDHAALQGLAENLPAIWHSETTQPEDRKRILRFIVQEVVLDQKKIRGQVAIRILWQTGATSEHQIQRRVQPYDRDYGELELVRERITELNAAGDMDRQIAKILNDEGVRSARGKLFSYENIWLLRHRWGIPTAKINGVAANPPRWPDGTYSVQGAAAAIGVTAQTIFDYLAQGLVHGRQSTKGQPWQISLSSDQIDQLQRRLQRTRRSRKGASWSIRGCKDDHRATRPAHPSLRDRRNRKRFLALQEPLSKLKSTSQPAAPDQAAQPRPASPDRELTGVPFNTPQPGSPFARKTRVPIQW